MTKQQLEEIKKRVEAATAGPGFVNFCPVNADTEQKIKDMMTAAIDLSKDHDGGHDFQWITTEDGVIVAFFGNGPTSKANAQLWAEARDKIPALLEHIESLQGQLVEAKKVIKKYTPKRKIDCHHDDPSWCSDDCNDYGFAARDFIEKYPNP